MSVPQLVINDRYAGNDFDIEHDDAPRPNEVTGVLEGGINPSDPALKAWFTVKTDDSVPDAQASLQKIVTASPVAGTGQMTENGSELQGNGTASFVFQITAADSALLGPDTIYVCDVQIETVAGKIYTSAEGTIRLLQRVTYALS